MVMNSVDTLEKVFNRVNPNVVLRVLGKIVLKHFFFLVSVLNN